MDVRDDPSNLLDNASGGKQIEWGFKAAGFLRESTAFFIPAGQGTQLPRRKPIKMEASKGEKP